MTDPLEGQDRPIPETTFVPSKEQIQQAFVKFVESKPWYKENEGQGYGPHVTRINEEQLFVASGTPDYPTKREFYMANPSDTGELDFFDEMVANFMPGVHGSQYKYEPFHIQVGGEHGTYVEVRPETLAEDGLELDFHYQFDLKKVPHTIMHDWISCQLTFTHKGRLTPLYDSTGQMTAISRLTHQVFKGKENKERVADFIHLSKDQVSRLKEEKRISIAHAGYEYEFVIEGDSVQATVFDSGKVKEEIKFPLNFNRNKDELFQKLASLGVLEDPLETVPSSAEKNYLTLLPRSIVNWVSHAKLPGRSY